MLRFPINWALTDVDVNTTLNGERMSKVKLNDEWTVICFWDQHQFGCWKPLSIKLRREFSCKETLICGTLSLSASAPVGGGSRMESKCKFSELMKMGSSPLEIKFYDPQHSLFSSGTNYFLHGFINIISITEMSSNDFENTECDQMKSLVQLSNDFECMLDPETCCFADVHLKCGDTIIPAHKSILSARSPVFSAMFKTPMKENRENKVDISDMNESVVRNMLIYIYTGKTYDLTVSLASELLCAGNKYQLQDLKRVCCNFLKDNISLENVLNILILGDMLAEDLKSCAVDFICNKCMKFSVLERNEEWKILRKERPDLAIDILTSMMKTRDEKLYQSPNKSAGRCIST